MASLSRGRGQRGRRGRSEDQEQDESSPLDSVATTDRMDDPALGAELQDLPSVHVVSCARTDRLYPVASRFLEHGPCGVMDEL